MANKMEEFASVIENKVEDLGWSIEPQGDYIYISQYSPAGEDFGFEVDGKSLADVVHQVCEYADNFDADEHAEMWINARGKVNGVPDSIRELIDDADAIQEMLNELAEKVKELIEE